jgi:hypothetical protein
MVASIKIKMFILVKAATKVIAPDGINGITRVISIIVNCFNGPG